MSKLGRVIVLTVPDFEPDGERVECYVAHALAGSGRVASALRGSLRLLDLDALFRGDLNDDELRGFRFALEQITKEAKP